MTLDVTPQDDTVFELDEAVQAFRDGKFDSSDVQSMTEASFILKRLCNNRVFLGDLVEKDVKDGFKDQDLVNHYSAQSYVLFKTPESFFFRANIWPSISDESFASSGPDAFLYDLPHDHNFNFLTAGYFGPGYSGSHFKYRYEDVHGYPGEKVSYEFSGLERLEPGQVVLYRANQDIHSQTPPESLSISLNILEQTPRALFNDQYIFSREHDRVSSVIARRCNPAFLESAALLLGDRAVDPLMRLYRTHDSDFVRCHALRAAYSASSDKSESEGLIREAAGSRSDYVRSWMKTGMMRNRSLFFA